MAKPKAFTRSEIHGYPVMRGKVRDVYDLGDRLVIITTDRVSAFDWILPQGIPDKGRMLNQMSIFWMNFLNVPNHLISQDLSLMGPEFAKHADDLQGRSILVKKTTVYPVECVARGYISGSGWKEYQGNRKVCGISLPDGLRQSDRLPEPIFTPATKAQTGHDENISLEDMEKVVGSTIAEDLKQKTLDIYRRASEYAMTKGIILADTKLEWGCMPDGQTILIDEVLTPDSSRFWDQKTYKPGISPPSFDKQFIRDWLETTSWDKNSPPPDLPEEIVLQTRERYLEAYRLLTGKEFKNS